MELGVQRTPPLLGPVGEGMFGGKKKTLERATKEYGPQGGLDNDRKHAN